MEASHSTTLYGGRDGGVDEAGAPLCEDTPLAGCSITTAYGGGTGFSSDTLGPESWSSRFPNSDEDSWGYLLTPPT